MEEEEGELVMSVVVMVIDIPIVLVVEVNDISYKLLSSIVD